MDLSAWGKKAMAHSNGNAEPAYRKIQGAIRRRIETGRLRAGDVVDSERELAKIHQVSLMTARHALTDLAKEGIVERRHGAGTFVAPPKIHFNKLMSYTEQMGGGASVQSKISDSGIVHNPEIAARLGLAAGAHLLKLERVRQSAGEPLALEACYLSAEAYPRLAAKALERGSLFATLERNYGVEISYSQEEIDATGADARTAELLHMDNGSPLLRIRQVIYSKQAAAILYVFALYRSARHTVLIRRYR